MEWEYALIEVLKLSGNDTQIAMSEAFNIMFSILFWLGALMFPGWP